MTGQVLVYAVAARADAYRELLSAACRATSVAARLELFGSGSLFRRLRSAPRDARADLVLGYGPYMAEAAARDGLLEPHQPQQMPDVTRHERECRWTAIDFLPLVASPAVSLAELASVPRLALADPERSETGTLAVLATLDRARQVEGDPERGWMWWQRRVRAGISLAEDEAGALASVSEGRASHALTLGRDGHPVAGLAPMPNAVGLAAGAPNAAAARQLLDWLLGPEARSIARGSALSGWQAASNGLQPLVEAAPPLDLDWTFQQYTATRRRWAALGLSVVSA